VLANELLACRLARKLGLPVPEPAVIELDEATIRDQNISFILDGRNLAPRAGLQFGSRMVTDDLVFEFLPDAMLERVRDRHTFAGMLAADKWLCNADGRQVIFHKSKHGRSYRLLYIDFGFIANLEWSFPDSPLRGTYPKNSVYDKICGWDDFEPWLSRIERFPEQDLFAAADDIPQSGTTETARPWTVS
jgi:hypothetical protein